MRQIKILLWVMVANICSMCSELPEDVACKNLSNMRMAVHSLKASLKACRSVFDLQFLILSKTATKFA